MRKAIAVSQIIMLVLGIIVLAVIGYLLYTNFLSSSSGINQQKCNSETLALCTQWQLSGQVPTSGPADYLTVCGFTQFPGQSELSGKCAALGVTGLPASPGH